LKCIILSSQFLFNGQFNEYILSCDLQSIRISKLYKCVESIPRLWQTCTRIVASQPASQRNVKFADTVLLDKYVGWLACKICLECLLRKMPSFPFYSFSSLSIRKKFKWKFIYNDSIFRENWNKLTMESHCFCLNGFGENGRRTE
jgi:hypothetical protein